MGDSDDLWAAPTDPKEADVNRIQWLPMAHYPVSYDGGTHTIFTVLQAYFGVGDRHATNTGATFYGHSYFDLGKDVATKTCLGNFTFYDYAMIRLPWRYSDDGGETQEEAEEAQEELVKHRGDQPSVDYHRPELILPLDDCG